MFHFFTRASFILGISIGIFLAVLLKTKEKANVASNPIPRTFQFSKYIDWFERQELIRRPIPFDFIRYGNKTYRLESGYLHDKVPVLCVILFKTSKNVQAAKATWGRHCNEIQLLNITSEKKKMPSIKRTNEESSWVLLCTKLKEIDEKFHWVVIVYDYTFVLVENLRLFVAGLNHRDKYYLGHAVKFWGNPYNMGQAGYVLSKGTVDSFKNKFKETGACTQSRTYRNQEDYYLGKNLISLNITPKDTRDPNGLSTFHPYNMYHVFFPGENYYKFSIYPQKCCSPYSITFQAIEGDKMYTYYYLLYTLQLFYYGSFGNTAKHNPLEDDAVWKNFLRDRGISENVSPEQYYKIWENIVDDPTSFAKHMKREEYFDFL